MAVYTWLGNAKHFRQNKNNYDKQINILIYMYMCDISAPWFSNYTVGLKIVKILVLDKQTQAASASLPFWGERGG